jgi:Fe-S-cluster-containing dehydrogenase component
MVSFYVTPCDYCLGATTDEPPCVSTCVRDAIAYREVDPAEHHMHIIDEHFAVIAPRWEKEKV